MRRFKLVLRLPSRFRRWILRRATERSARDEASIATPFTIADPRTGERYVEPAPYQLRVVRAAHDWLEALEIGAISALTRLRGRYHAQLATVEAVAEDLAAAQAKVRDILKFGGHGALAAVLLFAGAGMNYLVNWGFVTRFGWDFSTTVFADLVLVLAEVTATAFVGRGIAACMLDKPNTPFDLEPSERRGTVVYTVVIALLASALLGVVAYYRDSVVWTLAGLMAAGLGVWLGMALHESRFNRERDALRRRLERERRKAGKLKGAFEALQRQVLALARWLRDEAIRLLNRGDIAFQRAYRRLHRGDRDAVAPAVPVPDLPSDEELAERYTVSLEQDAMAEPQGPRLHALPAPGGEATA